MDCPHVSTCPISTKVPLIINSLKLSPACQVCSSVQSPWLCLQCGSINCGRYIHGHAKRHYDESNKFNLRRSTSGTSGSTGAAIAPANTNTTNAKDSDSSSAPPQHCVSIDCYSGAAFCYSCDEFISNVPEFVVQLTELMDEDGCGVGTGAGGVDSSPIRERDSRKRRSSSTSSSHSNSSMNGLVGPLGQGTTPGAVLGNSNSKRRRTAAVALVGGSTSTSTNNGHHSPGGHGRVNGTAPAATTASPIAPGLRNLGNTCFMNAVLQSLSKLRPFSTSISKLPISNSNHPGPGGPGAAGTAPITPKSPVGMSYSTRLKTRELELKRIEISNGSKTNGPSGASGATTTTPDHVLTLELKRIIGMLNNKKDQSDIGAGGSGSLNSTSLSPDALFSIIWEVMPRFRGHQQQDAHEFLRYMLDHLHSELVHLMKTTTATTNVNGMSRRRSSGGTPSAGAGAGHGTILPKNGLRDKDKDKNSSVPTPTSIVTELFGGILENEVTCTTCSTVSHKLDPFLDLSLDIPQNAHSHTHSQISGTGNGTDGPTNTNLTSLTNCLSSFTSVEYLTEDDQYHCAKCQVHTRSTKQLKIRKLPEVLCFHLKRFRWAHSTRSKVDNHVQFPVVGLDMGQYLGLGQGQPSKGSNSEYLYDLAAVIVHHGTGVGSGHYTAYAKNWNWGQQPQNPSTSTTTFRKTTTTTRHQYQQELKNLQQQQQPPPLGNGTTTPTTTWLHFNDSNVQLIDERELQKCKAYILFYTRRQQ